jgi:hypothetical protein
MFSFFHRSEITKFSFAGIVDWLLTIPKNWLVITPIKGWGIKKAPVKTGAFLKL